MTSSHYDEVLLEAREKGEIIANKYIFELYTILKDEEHLPPEDCRSKIEHDCIDLWSKATIRKFLPEEAKNPKKSKAGKLGAEQKKKFEDEQKLKAPQLIEHTTDGNIVTTTNTTDSSSSPGVRTNLAENGSFGQEEEESGRFRTELSKQLGGRTLSPELIEAAKIISEKDSRIKELEHSIEKGNSTKLNSELYLSEKLAEEIYNTIHIHRSEGILKTDFILRHDGYHITSVENLNMLGAESSSQGVEAST